MSKVIATRHVRHDWQTFVDWEQKSVRTLCGVTTRRHLAGIPGVSDQPRIVPVGERKLWGWCPRCVRFMQDGLRAYMRNDVDPVKPVTLLYDRAAEEVTDQWSWMMQNKKTLGGKSAEAL